MNSRLTIAVLLILIFLVGVVAYVSRQPRPPAHATKHNYVFSPHPGALKSFSYKPAHGPLLAFRHVGSHWLIVSPMKVRGRDYAIGDLAGTLADLKWRYRIRIASTGSHSLSRTGLAKPRGVLTLVDQAGKTFTLNIGTRNATGRLYVHLAGTHNSYVDVVKADWLTRLKRPVRKFRNRSLASFHTRNIAAIALRSAKENLRLVPHGKGWLITEPLLAPAANATVASWISNLQLLTAHRFSGVPAGQAGFKTASLTITVKFKTPKSPITTSVVGKKHPVKVLPAPAPLMIKFGLKTDLTGKFLYAQSSYNPGVCVVRNTSFNQLDESFFKLRDHHLVAANVSAQASGITITRRTGVTGNTPASLNVSKVDGKWRLGSASGRSVAAGSAAITKLLAALHSVTARRFLDKPADLAALGLITPSATWHLTITDHVHPIDIAFGKTQKSGLLPVKVSQWPSIYLVSGSAEKPLLPQLTALRSKVITDLTGLILQRITILRGGRTVTLNKTGGKWMLGAKITASAKSVNNLLAAWKPLKAQQWFINARSVSSVPTITVDMAFLNPVRPAAPATMPAKKPASMINPQYVPLHDVLTLWRINMPAVKAAGAKAKPSANPAATTQWRAELRKSGAAPANPVWSFQPEKSLVAAVRALLAK